MARVHRVALILTIVATSYLLTLFGVLSVPLVDPKVSEKILPVVHSFFFLYNDIILTISSAIMSLLIYTLWGFLSFVKCKFSLVQLCAPFDKLASMVATSCIWIVLSVVNRNGPFNTARMPRSLPWAAWSEFFPSYLSLLSFPIPGGVWFSHHYLETCFFRRRMATPESRCYSYIYTEANPQR